MAVAARRSAACSPPPGLPGADAPCGWSPTGIGWAGHRRQGHGAAPWRSRVPCRSAASW